MCNCSLLNCDSTAGRTFLVHLIPVLQFTSFAECIIACSKAPLFCSGGTVLEGTFHSDRCFEKHEKGVNGGEERKRKVYGQLVNIATRANVGISSSVVRLWKFSK